MPAAVRIVRLPPGADLAPGSALRLVPTPAHATRTGTSFGPSVLTAQDFADELVRTHDPAARPLTAADEQLVLDLVSTDLRDAGERSESKRNALVARRRLKLRRLTPTDRLRRAAELWGAGKRQPFDSVQGVELVGFDPVPPPVLDLLRAMSESVADITITIPDHESANDTVAHLARLGGEPDLFGPDPADITIADPSTRPPGIVHLIRESTNAIDATGVHRIDAPGPVAEARLIARAIRTALAEGVPAERIVVTARRLDKVVGLLAEVFDEYAVPFDPPTLPLARSPAVAALLRAWQVPDADYRFADTAALLRSTVVRFTLPTARREAELPAITETLLRRLDLPGGKDATLAAVQGWADDPPLPLEDEQAEEPRRRRTHKDAKRCRPFVEAVFKLWDRVPRVAGPPAFAKQLFRLAADVGLGNDADVVRFRSLVERWAEADWPLVAPRRTVSKATFTRMLTTLADHTPGSPPPTGGRVRLLPADAARGADCDHLFLTDLGEGEFPRPGADRDAELRLFRDLIGRPKQVLHLSYSALDEKGQELLPAAFLLAAERCFAPDAIPTTRQRMPIEGFAESTLISAAEARVRAARDLAAGRQPALEVACLDNLRAAAGASVARGRTRPFGAFDGLLSHPVVTADIAARFGPDKVFSPTALETYVACPFRFWLEHVLRLEPLDDPGDEVEHTRRGAAVHRALSRFHTFVRDQAGAFLAGKAVSDEADLSLEKHLEVAVDEYAGRSADAGTRVLWQLEGRRLARQLKRYRGQWDKFRDPWHANGPPTPHAFEADFGTLAVPPLTLKAGDAEIRLGGRIDRIDIADLGDEVGFWVIDYKTGGGTAYTAAALQRFEKLQLPLYAVAVERVLLKDRPARPLGLAYWMIAADGPKVVLPTNGRKLLDLFQNPKAWPAYRDQLEAWVGTLVGHVRGGHFPLAPRSETCTDTCPMGPVCRIAASRSAEKVWPMPLPLTSPTPMASIG